jgi:hypothetical protein
VGLEVGHGNARTHRDPILAALRLAHHDRVEEPGAATGAGSGIVRS